MVDKIDPTNLSSVEYGSQLLQQKQRSDAEYQKRVAKDQKIENWLTGISTVDKMMKDRATRNLNERNNTFEKLYIQETADYNRLQKEYDSQKGFRDAIENGDGAMSHARKLASIELGALPKFANMDLNTIDANDPFAQDYIGHLDRIAKQKFDAYNKNRVSLPTPTLEEYVSPLRDMQKKEVPAGVLNFIAEKVGWRDPMELVDIEETKTKYSPDLLESRRGTGRKGVSAKVATDLDLFNPFRGQLRKEVTKLRFDDRSGKVYQVTTDVDGNERLSPVAKDMDTLLSEMKPSMYYRIRPKSKEEIDADWREWKINRVTNYPKERNISNNQLLMRLRDSDKPSDIRLYTEVTRSKVVPLPTSELNSQAMATIIKSQLNKLPEEFKDKVTNLADTELAYFGDEVIRNANHIIQYGAVKDNNLDTNLESVAIQYAIENQLKGLTKANENDFLEGFSRNEYVFDPQKYDSEKYTPDIVNVAEGMSAEQFRRELNKNFEGWVNLTDEARAANAKRFRDEYGEPLGGDFPLTFDEPIVDKEVRDRYSISQIERGVPQLDERQKLRASMPEEEIEQEETMLDNLFTTSQNVIKNSISKPRFKYTMSATDYEQYENLLEESQKISKDFESKFGFSLGQFLGYSSTTRGGRGERINKLLANNPTLLTDINEFFETNNL